jgi:hypothetical protein
MAGLRRFCWAGMAGSTSDRLFLYRAGGGMPNPSPYNARMAKKRRRKPGNLQEVQRVLWTALCEAESVLLEADDPDQRLRAVHAVSQASGQYAKLLEVGEMHARLEALEKKLEALGASRAS